MNTKRIISTIFVAAICVFNAGAQINLLSDNINFRSSDNYDNETSHWGDLKLQGSGWGWLYCNRVYDWGSMEVYGNFYCYATKSFLQPHPTDTNKVIAYIAIESGEALTMVRGMSVTTGGLAQIALPEHFSLVTSADVPVTVLLTPEKSPVILYVKQKSKEKIIVAANPADYSQFGDVEFSYQVTGVRDGFEDNKVIRDVSNIDDTTAISPKRKEIMNKVKAIAMKEKAKGKAKK